MADDKIDTIKVDDSIQKKAWPESSTDYPGTVKNTVHPEDENMSFEEADRRIKHRGPRAETPSSGGNGW
jgi:hypothetical protein